MALDDEDIEEVFEELRSELERMPTKRRARVLASRMSFMDWIRATLSAIMGLVSAAVVTVVAAFLDAFIAEIIG